MDKKARCALTDAHGEAYTNERFRCESPVWRTANTITFSIAGRLMRRMLTTGRQTKLLGHNWKQWEPPSPYTSAICEILIDVKSICSKIRFEKKCNLKVNQWDVSRFSVGSHLVFWCHFRGFPFSSKLSNFWYVVLHIEYYKKWHKTFCCNFFGIGVFLAPTHLRS